MTRPSLRIDLDDLPPRVASQLARAKPGEEVLLIQNGVVVGRLLGGQAEPAPQGQADPDQPSEERAKEIFELFRSSVEDEF